MSVLFLADLSHVIHAFYHIHANPNTRPPNDEYDVCERVILKLDDLVPFIETFLVAANVAGPYHFVAVFDRPKPRDLFRTYLLPEYKQSRTKHEGLDEIEASILAAVKQCDRWLSVVAPPLMESDDMIASHQIKKLTFGKVNKLIKPDERKLTPLVLLFVVLVLH